MTGEIVWPTEYKILKAMDKAYCEEMNKELSDYRERQNEKNKMDMKRLANSGRR